MEVRQEERAWEGAAVRLLHNYALSVLVPDEHYASVAEWVERVLTRDPAQGRARVLMHTIVWQYLPLDTRDRIEGAVLAAGERAETRTPLAWLRVESDGAPDSAGVYLTLWPAGEDVSLGRADFHGRWTHWEKSPSRWPWRTRVAG